MRAQRGLFSACLLILGIGLAGCGKSENRPVENPKANADGEPVEDSSPQASPGMQKMKVNPEDIVFKDQVQTNATVPAGLDGLIFVDTKGIRVSLKDFIGKKHVILVFTEGFAGMLCPFCMTQTSRLVANYDKFQALDAEVLVVYPGERDHLGEFIEAARTQGKRQVDRVPFPIVLDEEMSAVDFFQIRSNLAHPSTYIIDKQGDVKLAYVGTDMSADRPSIRALLETLGSLEEKGQ